MPESNPDFDKRVREIVEAVLTDPLSLPREFKGWLPKYLEMAEPSLHLENMVGNINANRIRANSISADKLEAVLALISALLAGDPEGARVEMGKGITFDGDGNAIVDDSFTGIRAYDGDGNLIFKLDASGGTALFKGKVYFGGGDPGVTPSSRLTVNDMVQLAEQTSGTYQAPALEQSNSSAGVDVSARTCAWDHTPTENNTLIMTVALFNGGGGATITATGWSEAENHTFAAGDGRQAIYYKAAGASEGSPSISFGANVGNAIMQIFEYSGLQAVEHSTSDSAFDNDTTAATGTTGAITQDALVVGVLGAVAETNGPNLDPFDNVTADYTQVGSDLVLKQLAVSGFSRSFRALENTVFTKLAMSGTETVTAETPFVVSSGNYWGGAIATFAAAVAAVEPAEADTARLYSAEVSGTSYLHSTDENGRESAVALGKAGEVWRTEFLTATKDFASVTAHSGTTETVTITGLVVGDYAELIGHDFGSDAGRSLIIMPNPPICGTTNTLTVAVFNAKATDSDPTSATLYFKVTHRS